MIKRVYDIQDFNNLPSEERMLQRLLGAQEVLAATERKLVSVGLEPVEIVAIGRLAKRSGPKAKGIRRFVGKSTSASTGKRNKTSARNPSHPTPSQPLMYQHPQQNRSKMQASAIDGAVHVIHRIGERVNHKKFGNGVVVKIEGKAVTVVFEKTGERKIVASFLSRVID